MGFTLHVRRATIAAVEADGLADITMKMRDFSIAFISF